MTDTAPVIHIMLDLETWGTDPGDDIRSIGACVFDPDTGQVWHRLDGHIPFRPGDMTFYVATDNPIVYRGPRSDQPEPMFPLNRNPDTVKWWSEQSVEAQAAFENPVRLDEALKRFSAWVQEIANGDLERLRIWAHGPQFDVAILDAAYTAVGQVEPYRYRAPRDTRTMFEAAGMDAATCVQGFAAPGAVYHHALDDAITQARAVCAAFATVNNWRYDAEAHRVDDDIPTPPAAHPYGHCPTCNRPGSTRERRPNGDDRCDSGHRYPSADAKPCRCA